VAQTSDDSIFAGVFAPGGAKNESSEVCGIIKPG